MFYAPVITLFILFVIPAGSTVAQEGQSAPTSAPYAGLDARPIKALSTEQIADLKAGRGMGLALSAELNGYPGPVHVLERADRLELTGEQRSRVRMLYEAMKSEAVPLGERLITQESDLDRQFAERTITPTTLDRTTTEIGRTQAALRAAHLKYHLAMMDVLAPDQVRRYAELRGYGMGHPPHGSSTHGRH